jgi:NADH-quinone oxidoreductase subunit L
MEHTVQSLGPLATTNVGYLWLIPFFPLLGAAINAIVGWRLQRLLGKRIVHLVAISAMTASFAVAAFAFMQMHALGEQERFLQDTLWHAFGAGRVSVEFAFALDPLSMMMTLIITFIGTLIHVFSVGYMADEPAYWRFFSYLNLFVFSMLMLVMGDNFVVMFFGWEGVGLCSYLLIAFWYTDPEKAAAGMKAFVVNRFGDFGFLLGLLVLFWGLGGSWDSRDGRQIYRQNTALYDTQIIESTAERSEANPGISAAELTAKRVIKLGPTLNFRELRDQIVIESTGVAARLKEQSVFGFDLLSLVGILLFVGAMGKSAQLPLFVWLPDAMAGPTPVSALIHAATMVTAGVYMVARLNFIYALSPAAMGWVALVGALTAIFAASIGFFQYDIKKVLAYSTVSQLGFMFIGVGVGAYWAGAYHLLTHAFFKATLFLGSGSVILACHHEQDMRKMGGLGKHMPVTRFAYLAACWAIAGFPWASGFYSKDEILWKAFAQEGLWFPGMGRLIYVIGIITATGTAFYMFRSYYMTFTGEYRGAHQHRDEAAAACADDPANRSSHDDHDHDHGNHDHHGGMPKESPRSITLVLATLAGGSILVSLLGIPHAWSGHAPALEQWLEPALPAVVEFADHAHATEFMFQCFGVLAGVVGWAFARLLYKDGRSAVPARMLERWRTSWTIVYNKYYVDEFYAATIVRGSVQLSRLLSWLDSHVIDGIVHLAGAITRLVANLDGAIDKYVVDGAVNLLANTTIAAGRSLRLVQTGRIQTYLYSAFAGALAVVVLNFLVQ